MSDSLLQAFRLAYGEGPYTEAQYNLFVAGYNQGRGCEHLDAPYRRLLEQLKEAEAILEHYSEKMSGKMAVNYFLKYKGER